MKASELMIGDWVECTYWTPSKQLKVAEIRRIMDEEIKIGVYCDDLVLIFRQSEVKPIPLTQEILKKNGFIYDDNWHISWIEVGNYRIDVSFDYDGKVNYIEITEQGKGFSIPSEREILYLTHIKYVHELQHALKLCKIEKEIEL